MSLNLTCKDTVSLVANKLINKKWKLAVAESCTGGMLGTIITNEPGSSLWFQGGIIAYQNEIKQSLLNVPSSILIKNGAVSRETVIAMSKGVCKLLSSECSIAVSGIAGPGGGTWEKPVGLVYIGVTVLNTTESSRYIFSGNRNEIREQTVLRSLLHLNNLLKNT
jgi:nicotinamide-nucleotide amidase